MTNKVVVALMVLALSATPVLADDFSGRAALGGGLGGALGAYLGAEVDGRGGAVLGGALGGAAGTAIITDGYYDRPRERVFVREVYHYPVERHYYREDRHYYRDAHHYYRDDHHYRERRHHHRRDHFCPPKKARKGRC